MYLIDSIGLSLQSAMTLYIYRVGRLTPQEIMFTDLNLLRTLITVGFFLDRSDWSDPPVRPVGLLPYPLQHQTGQTAWSNRSDRLMPILAVNICLPLFFGKACLPKNILLNQNCLRATIGNASAIYYL